MRKVIVALLLLILSVHAQPSKAQQTNIYPGKSWEYIKDPAPLGWNNDKLSALREFIIDSANTTGMMVVQHGKVIFSYGDVKEVSYIASCRKSILSMLYGPFVENGKIKLDQKLAQLNINDVGGLLPIEKKATIRDLLTARSGIYHEASYLGDEYAIAPKRGTVKPGSLFLYNNWDFNLAGYVFEKQTGLNIYDALDSILVGPLKMEDWDRRLQQKEGDVTRSVYLAYPMWFSTRDMARIGYLMLRNGKWENNQIIPKNWLNTITTPFSSFKEISAYRDKDYTDFGYGYLWWAWDKPNDNGAFKGAYTAQGYFGQYITVLPALDLVIAHKTNDKYERATTNYFKILQKLVNANQADENVQNPIKSNTLQADLKSAKPNLEQYTGLYQLPFGPDKILQVALKNDTLLVEQLWRSHQEIISAVTDSSFITKDGTMLNFSEINGGKSGNLTIKERGSSFSAYRINPPEKSTLPAYEGLYYSKDLGFNYEIKLDNGVLYVLNKTIEERFPLNGIEKDLFRATQQHFKFTRSADGKKIIGFSILTKTLNNENFLRVKSSTN